jgi:hypothetical protein
VASRTCSGGQSRGQLVGQGADPARRQRRVPQDEAAQQEIDEAPRRLLPVLAEDTGEERLEHGAP